MKFKNTVTGQWVEATDWQLALKAGDYYLIEQPIIYLGSDPSAGPTVYGQIITNEPAQDEPPYRPGRFLVRGFSQWCPEGELGEFCIVDASHPLTPEEFEQARATGWPNLNLPENIELYAFIQKGIAGAPPDIHGLHLTGDPNDAPKPIPPRQARALQQAGYAYWALSFAAYDDYPAVLVHVYYEGQMPSDQERDGLNRAVQQVTGKALFGEEPDEA